MNGAIRGMVNSLNDPYSIYMDDKMYKEFPSGDGRHVQRYRIVISA